MELFHVSSAGAQRIAAVENEQPAQGFLWIDATHEEVAADSAAWRALVERASGVRLHEAHISDVNNLAHPSYCDATQSYALLVFRKLALDETSIQGDTEADRKRRIPALMRLGTKQVSFLIMPGVLAMVRPQQSRTLQAARDRVLEYRQRSENGQAGPRPPANPAELTLRLLNAMVDQYLALREPLTRQIDRWQRALLDPHSRFNNWLALLDARVELRKLEQLCEGQHDAVQELRDYLVDTEHAQGDPRTSDQLLVRANDVMEHITRVLTHTQRLETGIESAVQIHFSAMAHRTSEVMRILTVITALFMPLTLITGVFGMNFAVMPLLADPSGFWISLGMMAATVAVLLLLFWRKRYLEQRMVDPER